MRVANEHRIALARNLFLARSPSTENGAYTDGLQHSACLNVEITSTDTDHGELVIVDCSSTEISTAHPIAIRDH